MNILTQNLGLENPSARLIDQMHIVVAAAIAAYIPVFYLVGANFSALFLSLSLLLLNPTIIFISRKRHANWAGLFLLIVCNLDLFVCSLGTGHQGLLQIYCLAAMLGGVLLFKRERKEFIAISFTVSLFTGALICFGAGLPFANGHPLGDLPARLLGGLNFAGAALMMAAFLRLFVREFSRQQTQSSGLLESLLKTKDRLLLMQRIDLAIIQATDERRLVSDTLATLCYQQGSQLGLYWELDIPADKLNLACSWSASQSHRSFETALLGIRFGSGLGLPGRVWENDSAAWIVDLRADANFPHAQNAEACGLRSALAFPVKAGEQVVGVIEIYSAEVAPKDQALLDELSRIGQRLGQALNRVSSERRLEAAQRMAKVGNWSLNVASGRVLWSKQMYELFALDSRQPEPDLEAQLKMIHPEDKEFWLINVRGFVESGNAHSFKYRIVTAKGTVWIEAKGTGSKDDQGKVLSLSGTCQDVTDRLLAEKKIEQINSQQKAILDSSSYAIISTDANGLISTFNIAAERMLGYRADEVIGKVTLAIVHVHEEVVARAQALTKELGREIKPDFASLVTKAMAYGPDTQEWTFVRKDGSRFPVRLTISTISSDQQTHSGFLGMVLDLTEERKAQEIIELQRRKLIASAKMSALGEMAGGLAHEMNTPLAIIHAKAGQLKEKLARGPLDQDEIAKSLSKIEVTAERIAKIIKGLRSFSRNAEADPIESVSLNKVIEDALELCRERFRNQSITLRTEIPADISIECRSSQISQVLVNLLGNAYDAVAALEERWILLEVFTYPGVIRVSITDSGPGLAPEVADRIMQPFFTTKEIGRGTGLGLSVAKGISEDHHGNLSYDPSAKNTRFVIELPIVQPATTRQEKRAG